MNDASRLSAVSMAEELKKKHEMKSHRYQMLSEYLVKNPPPLEVEELLWAMMCSNSGGHYL